MGQTLLILTIALPWLGALLVWLVSDTRPRMQHGLAVAFSVLAGAAAVLLIPYSRQGVMVEIPMGESFGVFTLAPDGLGVFLGAIATVVGSLAVIFSVDYMRGEAQLGRYYALVLFFIGAMVGLVYTTNLLLIFFFWEITALCSYALISFHNDDPKAVAGGMKALIITQIGGVGLLLGALLIYSYTGSFNLNDFLVQAPTLPANVLSVMAFGFLIAAAAKSAQFPFQTWLPDAMEAPTPISALIHAATMVNAGVYLLARFYPAFAPVPGWKTAVMLVGLISVLMSSIMALVATDLKRVLAYSTVSQLGLMVYAVGVGGIFSSQFHLLSHSVFKALLFLAAGAIIHATGTRDMRQMGGLGAKMPFVRFVFIVGALALAGIPILNGFWSKELILEDYLTGGPIWMYVLAVISVAMTACYTLRMIWMVFYGQPRAKLHAHDAGTAMKVAFVPLALGTLLTWLLAGPLSKLFEETMPLYHVEAITTQQMVQEILTAPATYFAVAVVLIGFAAFWQRERLQWLVKAFSGVAQAATNSFGFETINRKTVTVVQDSAESLRVTQTGLVSWNVLGIVAALVILLAVLVLGA
jgi:NADH-quinone oxidoreductase subunit L